MKAYKVFRVVNGELYSAFETGRKKLHYKEGKTMIDPKPRKNCTGLMILLDKVKAYEFLSACPTYDHFSLHMVSTLRKIRQDVFAKVASYSEAEVDKLTVRAKIADNRQGGNK